MELKQEVLKQVESTLEFVKNYESVNATICEIGVATAIEFYLKIICTDSYKYSEDTVWELIYEVLDIARVLNNYNNVNVNDIDCPMPPNPNSLGERVFREISELTLDSLSKEKEKE